MSGFKNSSGRFSGSMVPRIGGAILVQNTAWGNVELALANLRGARRLSLVGLSRTPQGELEQLIRPAGFFRQKAATIRAFLVFLNTRYQGSLRRMFAEPTDRLRTELLAIKGIGPETADSILLYAGGHASFVVDAYTRRVLTRHGLISVNEPPGYEALRSAFEMAVRTMEDVRIAGNGAPRHSASPMSRRSVEPLAKNYQELHAMIVRVGSSYCQATPACAECPLRNFE
jgi:endonuclease-3 related protein